MRQTDRPFYGAMVERRDGPSWLRDDDDDDERALMLCGREGNRMSGVALAMRHRL